MAGDFHVAVGGGRCKGPNCVAAQFFVVCGDLYVSAMLAAEFLRLSSDSAVGLTRLAGSVATAIQTELFLVALAQKWVFWFATWTEWATLIGFASRHAHRAPYLVSQAAYMREGEWNVGYRLLTEKY